MPDPDRAFRALIGFAVLAVLILAGGSIRLLLAGAQPTGTSHSATDITCLFLPTTKDAGTHLLSYLLLGVVLIGSTMGIRAVIAQSRKNGLFSRLGHLKMDQSWSRLDQLATRLGMASSVVLVHSTQPKAFCYGLLRPRICVTTALVERLTESELEAVLLHEKYHLEKHDPLKVAIGRIVTTSLFFLPVVKSLYDRYLIAKEIAADEKAIREQGQRRSLASALDKLLALNGTGYSNLVEEAEGVGLMNHRIDFLLGSKPSAWDRLPPLAMATSVVVLALGMVALIAPVEALRGLALFGLGSQTWCHAA